MEYLDFVDGLCTECVPGISYPCHPRPSRSRLLPRGTLLLVQGVNNKFILCDTLTPSRLYSCSARGTRKMSLVHAWLF